MNKYQIADYIYSNFGHDMGFLANVIITHHSRPCRKVNSLLRLLETNHRVRLGQFSIGNLYIDDILTTWDKMENYAK